MKKQTEGTLMSKLERTDKEKLQKWIIEHDGDDFCAYCNCDCENVGVTGGPNGPIYPPCADWNDDKLLENLDTEAILDEINQEES